MGRLLQNYKLNSKILVMNYRVLFSLLCLFSVSAYAQKKGVIYDLETRVPIRQVRVRVDKSRTYTDANKDGTISLDFNTFNVNLDYEMRAAYGDVYDEASGTNVFNGDEYGLNYFVADVNYAGNGLISNEEVTTMGSSGSQASRMDTRLTGTRNYRMADRIL